MNHDPNKFWKKLHTMFPDKPNSGKINIKDSVDGEMLEEANIPNYANEFFTNIGTNTIHDTGFEIDEWTYNGLELPGNFRLQNITIENVLSEIKNLKITKPSGIDNISTKIIRDALWILAYQFTWLLNLSIDKADVPNKWKKAKISIIPKDGDLTDTNNFRPIAILPVVSKIMEHLIQAQTIRYLEENDILDVNQGGFRKNNSTTATTASMLDDIYENINNQQITFSVFIDFRKAFHSINHEILLKKLLKLGFHAKTRNWFENYLTNRTQYTVVNGIKSGLLGMDCGVPQGSVLGPMLFLIFINDLGSSIKHSRYKLYADDTVIYSKCTGEDTNTLCAQIQSDLNNVHEWCKKNAIMMKVKKTKTMMFGTRHRLSIAEELELSVNERLLECVPHYKYLGTFVDSELSFVKQSNETIKSISYKLYYLGKIKAFFNTATLIKLYKSYIQPYFDYNSIFLETTYIYTTARQYNKLVTLERRCLGRCLPENMRVDQREIYNITGRNKLKDRAESYLLKLMYKRTDNEQYVDQTEGKTRLHDAPVLLIPFPNNETFRKSITFRGASLWNNLPAQERNTPTFDRFKNLLKQKLVEKIT